MKLTKKVATNIQQKKESCGILTHLVFHIWVGYKKNCWNSKECDVQYDRNNTQSSY